MFAAFDIKAVDFAVEVHFEAEFAEKFSKYVCHFLGLVAECRVDEACRS